MEKVLVLSADTLEVLDRIQDPFAHIPVDLDNPDEEQLAEVWNFLQQRYGEIVLAQDLIEVKKP